MPANPNIDLTRGYTHPHLACWLGLPMYALMSALSTKARSIASVMLLVVSTCSAKAGARVWMGGGTSGMHPW